MKPFFILLSILFLTSCGNTKEVSAIPCGTNNPLEDIAWLKEIKTGFDMSASATKKQIIQYMYNNETVFLIDACIGCPDSLTTVYNCKKEVVCQFGGIAGFNTCPDFNEKATNKKIVWEN